MYYETVEYIILEYLVNFTHFEWIARDQNENLCVYDKKPYKEENPDCINSGYWICDGNTYDLAAMTPFNDIFQSIQWENEEPTLIEEALNRYE